MLNLNSVVEWKKLLLVWLRALDKEELDFIMTLATIELSGGGASNLRPDV